MATYREVVYNTITSLRRAFDDSDIQVSQVFFWTRVVADRLAREVIELEEQKGNIGGNFLSVFNSVPIKSDSKGRKYVDIPTVIMDINNDAGINYVTYGCNTCAGESVYNIANVMFQRTTPKGLNALSLDTFTKPSASNPYYYRVGCAVDGVDVNRIYIAGAEKVNFNDLELGVICGIDSSASCSLDDEIPLPSEHIQTLMVNVLQLGRFNTLIPEERINEGADDSKGAAAQVPIAQSRLLQRNIGKQTQSNSTNTQE